MAGLSKGSEQELLQNLADAVVKIAQNEAPVQTGALKRSIGILSESENEIIVGHLYNPDIMVNWQNAKVIYPLFVHEGTSAHVRERTTKKGRKQTINHPGQKANPYFKRAIKHPQIKKILKDYGDKLVMEIAKELENESKA